MATPVFFFGSATPVLVSLRCLVERLPRKPRRRQSEVPSAHPIVKRRKDWPVWAGQWATVGAQVGGWRLPTGELTRRGHMGEAAGSCDYVNRDAGAPFWLFGVWRSSTGSMSHRGRQGQLSAPALEKTTERTACCR